MGERERQGWDDHLVELLVHSRTPLSHSLPHTQAPSFTVSALIWAVTVLTARCFCTGISAQRILQTHGAQRLLKNPGHNSDRTLVPPHLGTFGLR